MESSFIAKPKTQWAWVCILQYATCECTSSQNSVLLRKLCCRIYEPQLSCIGANAAVLLHFMVIIQTFPWTYCQSGTNTVHSSFSICHLWVAMVHTIQFVTWHLFVYKKIVFCVKMMYRVTATQFLTFFVEIWEWGSDSFLIKLKLQQLLSSSFCLAKPIIFLFMNSH